ncbi:M23 family metallopeptidase [Roseospira visakhapatnamensis]|uniref:Murein DD-endopeptidase MepM/ murein hydrolase activator NlpD n=1 Tax=Roseospira visakhapatnamensis TaxID=390880 RepID=A0A7W6W7Y7_9PROT|nr:peptidoglycan DD-metalloendopeptidase family protein [Roseospira visakhapatnamensis]MBB4264395.1 murein DD-endopeptidase MepM/ murein hydrolase activator NlpD [Roseospira visakhapatnamensis]
MVDPVGDPTTPTHQTTRTIAPRAGRVLSTRLAVSVMAGFLLAGTPAGARLGEAPGTSDPMTDMALIAALDGKPAPITLIPGGPQATPQATVALTGAHGWDTPPAAVTRGFAFGALADMIVPAGPPATAPTGLDNDSLADTPTASGPIDVPARVDSGDTLIGLLIEAGVDRVEAHRAVKVLEEVYDPRGLRPGHVVQVRFAPPSAEDDPLFQGFALQPSVDTEVVVRADPDCDAGYTAEEMKETLVRDVVRFGGPITYSLYQAAVDAGVSEAALADMIRVLSYDIDFQRDIQKDDTFEIMYERFSTADGKPVRNGQLLFTALTNGGNRIVAYAHETEDGTRDYFNESGQGVRKPLMRTPIDGARISSSFGMRRHPILGYSKMHTGVDFAAPTGTPIYAAGDGVVKRAGRNGGYGNYIQIRHNGEFSTAYGHLSRILVRNGQRVEQGDVIGRVGSTGRSTGPHLHYEIIRGGKKVNPLDVRFQPAIQLAGAELDRFMAHKAETDRLYASLRNATEVASAAAPVTRPAP